MFKTEVICLCKYIKENKSAASGFFLVFIRADFYFSISKFYKFAITIRIGFFNFFLRVCTCMNNSNVLNKRLDKRMVFLSDFV